MKLITRDSSTAIFSEWERPGLRVGFMYPGSRLAFFARALLCPGNESKEGGMSTTAALKTGMKGSSGLLVGEEHTAPRVGSGRVHVLATPVMINVIEAAALAAIEHLLPAGHQSLGTRLDIRHFAATPVGMRVRVKVAMVRGRTEARR